MPFEQISRLQGNPLCMLGYVFAADGSGEVGINVKDHP